MSLFSRARQVGVCLKHLPTFNPAEPDLYFYHDANVPWQRVVNSKGGISPRGDDGAAANRQAERLRAEGVEVHEARGALDLLVAEFDDRGGAVQRVRALADCMSRGTCHVEETSAVEPDSDAHAS